MTEDVVIVAARRTPIGAFQGALSGATAPQLGAAAVRAALADSRASGEQIDEVILGCVLPAGLGQAPARQAAIGAGLPSSVPATTINKVCGSGMRSAMLGCDSIRAGSARGQAGGARSFLPERKSPAPDGEPADRAAAGCRGRSDRRQR